MTIDNWLENDACGCSGKVQWQGLYRYDFIMKLGGDAVSIIAFSFVAGKMQNTTLGSDPITELLFFNISVRGSDPGFP
jgi:hypothetical protein